MQTEYQHVSMNGQRTRVSEWQGHWKTVWGWIMAVVCPAYLLGAHRSRLRQRHARGHFGDLLRTHRPRRSRLEGTSGAGYPTGLELQSFMVAATHADHCLGVCRFFSSHVTSPPINSDTSTRCGTRSFAAAQRRYWSRRYLVRGRSPTPDWGPSPTSWKR